MDSTTKLRCDLIAKISCLRDYWPNYFIDVDTDSCTNEQLSTLFADKVKAISSKFNSPMDRHCELIAKINCLRDHWPNYFIDVNTDSCTDEQLSTLYADKVEAIYSQLG